MEERGVEAHDIQLQAARDLQRILIVDDQKREHEPNSTGSSFCVTVALSVQILKDLHAAGIALNVSAVDPPDFAPNTQK
jgi:hypothetical protein